MAYQMGLVDGNDWDLENFDVSEEGWDELTINALGVSACSKLWGVEASGDAWDQACADYNRGVIDAIKARR